MLDLLTREPWLIPATIGVLIPVAGIILGMLKSANRARQTELEISLKHEMLQRGMSADEIVRVLQARSGRASFSEKCPASGHELHSRVD
jgi:hypothetical protein